MKPLLKGRRKVLCNHCSSYNEYKRNNNCWRCKKEYKSGVEFKFTSEILECLKQFKTYLDYIEECIKEKIIPNEVIIKGIKVAFKKDFGEVKK